MAGMVLVNNSGDEPSNYWPLKHAEWNGWTPTDLVFPFFLFIVGVAMAFSFSSRLKRGESRQDLLGHVLWRGLVLFALGLLLNGFPNEYHLASWRVYGVPATDRDLLRDYGDSGFVDGLARVDCPRRWSVWRGVLDPDALCSGAGIRSADSRYPAARS